MKHKTIPANDFVKSIDRFELLSLATKEGIWEYDFATKESFYNEGITELFGHDYPELEDNDSWWRNNIHPQDKNRIINALDELLEGKENVWWGKYHFRCKDGNYKLILDRLFVVRGSDDKPLRLIGTMQDLTEIETLEQKFEKIRRENQNAMHKAIFQAEENERKKISDELHENINQVLAAINLHISQAKSHVDKQGHAWLEEAQHLLMESITGIRVLSKKLSPVALEMLGLKRSLEELLDSLQKSNRISYSLSTANIDFFNINLDIQTLFYRIVEQQVLNVLTHSKATHITLKFIEYNGKIKMTFRDNGDGINIKNIQFGKGFSTIQERSAAFAGSFNLESIEGKNGFTMEVIV